MTWKCVCLILGILAILAYAYKNFLNFHLKKCNKKLCEFIKKIYEKNEEEKICEKNEEEKICEKNEEDSQKKHLP